MTNKDRSNSHEALSTTTSQTGSISLQSSGDVESSLLEAHPGSPIDLNGRRRPSLSAAMAAQRPLFKPQGTRSSPIYGKTDNCIMTGGVVAKAANNCKCELVDNENGYSPKTKLQTAATQPFFIPAKVPEHYEVHTIHSLPSPSDDGISMEGAMEHAMDFHFEEENGIWISAIPRAHDSRASFCTGTSTLVEDRYNHSALTVDTSVGSSDMSVLSSAGSVTSGTTNSTDIYGWEEELDRKSSMESQTPYLRDHQRRLPSGGRTSVSRARNETLTFRQLTGKRKSLLHRVLNISRREINEPLPVTSTTPLSYPSSMN